MAKLFQYGMELAKCSSQITSKRRKNRHPCQPTSAKISMDVSYSKPKSMNEFKKGFPRVNRFAHSKLGLNMAKSASSSWKRTAR